MRFTAITAPNPVTERRIMGGAVPLRKDVARSSVGVTADERMNLSTEWMNALRWKGAGTAQRERGMLAAPSAVTM
jgi:hypothetical protein